jgi:hypothetical protein
MVFTEYFAIVGQNKNAMKIRLGFVSNSSSASFVVTKGLIVVPTLKSQVLDIPYTFNGEMEFPRSYGDYYDIGSRINWAALQAASFDKEYILAYEDMTNGYWSKHDLKLFKPVKLLHECLMHRFHISKIYFYFNEADTDNYHLKKLNPNLSEEKLLWLSNFPAWGEIDHASLIFSSPENAAIFESEQKLAKFIFGEESAVHVRCD